MKAHRRAAPLLTFIILLFVQNVGEAGTPGGTVLQNVATATYRDATSTTYASVSNTVSTTVAAIGALVVTPKETGCNPQTDVFSIGVLLKRTFTISNVSNVADAYTIVNATTSGGKISVVAFVTPDGTIIPASVGAVSPLVQPGGSIQVQISVATSGVAVGTQISIGLTARTTVAGTANGLQTDSGQQCGIAAAGAAFTQPGVLNAISKLVDGVPAEQIRSTTTVHYTIAFTNSGGVPAYNATLADNLPVGMRVDPSSLKLNGVPLPSSAIGLKGSALTVALGTIPPQTPEAITFDAAPTNLAALGTSLVNIASVTADNATAVKSTPATVFIGDADVVYDGDAGVGAPIANATLQIVDPATGSAITPSSTKTTRSAGSNAALATVTTGSSGTYQFQLSAAQIGTSAHPAVYDLLISASGYLSRHLRLTLTPDPTFTVFTADVAALDGQLLAAPGDYRLMAGPVQLDEVYGFFGNFPLFPQRSVQIDESVDRSLASAGDRLIYTVHFGNRSSYPLGSTTLTGTLPPGLVYAPATARVDGVALEPVQRGRTLTWSFAALNQDHTLTYATVVMPGVDAGTTLTNPVTIAAIAPNNPNALTAAASVDVQVSGGVFAARIAITGRVYVDDGGTGRFTRADEGVANVRIFLEDGESVTTDRFGRFSFPAARPGLHVLRLDETTLPSNLQAFPVRNFSDERSTRRLVHGVFDGGTMQDISFAVRRAS